MSVFSHKKPPTDDSPSESIEEVNSEHPLTEIVRFSIIAILIVIPIRMFIAQPFIVSGASMNDTFANGQYLIVDQVSYYFEKPNRGDVVVFRYPKDPSKFFIKRVVALPGETISINDSAVTISNKTFPDGFILEEPYIKSMKPTAAFVETLGGREYFVMGDNRDQSSDSRSWGVLQEERIVGRAIFRLFPPSVIDYLPGALEDINESYVPQS
ncbi:MAG: signal peptidase I [Candidatus Paceibacteria bacterium]|jgi:signal peptidase I